MKRVLDASALLTGRPFVGELYTVPEVLSEVRRHGVTFSLEAILETRVALRQPSREATEAVAAASGTTGDAPRLSPTDVALLALALDLDATLVTDDYSIQNVARFLAVPYEGVVEPGIRERWTWTYRCPGCKRTWREWRDECPTCGTPLRTARSPRQPR
jgi:UPF0271 protein